MVIYQHVSYPFDPETSEANTGLRPLSAAEARPIADTGPLRNRLRARLRAGGSVISEVVRLSGNAGPLPGGQPGEGRRHRAGGQRVLRLSSAGPGRTA
jgi:hypothetical protein